MDVQSRGPVKQWVKDLTEEVVGGAPFAVGDTVPHPSGRTVKIVDGQYWATQGFSNHWTWQEVRADGTLGPEESGYGWDPKNPQKPADSAPAASGPKV